MSPFRSGVFACAEPVRPGGNGLESVEGALDDRDYARLRIGVLAHPDRDR